MRATLNVSQGNVVNGESSVSLGLTFYLQEIHQHTRKQAVCHEDTKPLRGSRESRKIVVREGTTKEMNET